MSWNPTHAVVSVQRARDLLAKGKNGTNDAFVTIALEKNKFQTTIKDSVIDPEWYEECDVPLPENYVESKLTLQVFHKNALGIDEFLGHLEVPLQSFDVYDPPRSIWYALQCKPGQNKTKPRGELEVRVAFEVKKMKDLDTLSTASATSKRFKMSKKSVAHAIGKKIKGKKHEKTTDYIPDLTELDQGALGMDDIAENYGTPVSVEHKRKKSVPNDSLSLPPSSPIFKRTTSRGSKGYSPFSKRRSQAETDSVASSNASTEDVHHRLEDSGSSDPSFIRTHRRGGSGSDMSGKPPKVNRRLLTSKIKSQSTYDVSASNTEFDHTPDRSSLDDSQRPRARAESSGGHSAVDPVPEIVDTTRSQSPDHSSSNRKSSVLSSKIPDQPVLIDDDSEGSADEFRSHSPALPIKAKKDEPSDLFARAAEQMREEQEDQFSFVQHEPNPTEEVFSPVGKLTKAASTATATSTPISTSDDKPSSKPTTAKTSRAKKAKPNTPAANVFDLLMASDEPEYNVDDTLPRNVDPSSNPFAEEDTQDAISGKETSGSTRETVPSQAIKDTHTTKSINEPETMETNPFSEPSDESASPFDKPEETSNPFEEPANPFDESKGSLPEEPKANVSQESGSNPFEESESNPFDELGTNPFEEPQANPFEEKPVSSSPKPASGRSTLAAPVSNSSNSTNPFEDSEEAGNPFAADERSAMNPFTRSGSSRYKNDSRQKKREKKGSAPAPPKPKRANNPDPTISVSPPPDDSKTIGSSSPAPTPSKASEPLIAHSPKTRSHKKKAPSSPAVTAIKQELSSRDRSFSHNQSSVSSHQDQIGGDKKSRSSSHLSGRLEQSFYDQSAKTQIRSERQPAIGAEAPDKPSEPVITVDVSVQTSHDGHDTVSSEFRNHSKQELVEMIQKLRQQIRKKDDHVKDLEEYIDSLLLRVMSSDPNLLVTQSSCSKQANQLSHLR